MTSSNILSSQYNLSDEKIHPVYIVAGERPITAPVITDLLSKLLSEDEMEFNLDVIPAENFSEDILLEKLNTRPFSPGRKVVLLRDPPFARGMEDMETKEDKGFGNVLNWITLADAGKTVLVIETAFYDAGSPFYKKVKEFSLILDMGCDVRDKKKKMERTIQYVRTYLKEEKRGIEQEAVPLLLEYTGDGSLALLKAELEKLVQHSGGRTLITREDVVKLTIRHREEEIFRITDAISERNVGKALASLNLLIIQGIHPIAIFQAIVTFLRRMLTLKSLCEKEGVRPGGFNVSYQTFQRDFFPKIKIDSVHPYPLYKMFLQSEKFDQKRLLDTFLMLPWIDLELKGGDVSAGVLLENLIVHIIIKEYESIPS